MQDVARVLDHPFVTPVWAARSTVMLRVRQFMLTSSSPPPVAAEVEREENHAGLGLGCGFGELTMLVSKKRGALRPWIFLQLRF